MKTKYMKILISLVLVLSLCFAYTFSSAYAIETPIVVGGTALAIGGLAWIIANAMGVDFDLQNYTTSTVDSFIDPYYNIQSVLNTTDFTLIKGARAGYDAIKLSLQAYNVLKSGPVDIIESNNIPDNTISQTGQIYTYNNYWFNDSTKHPTYTVGTVIGRAQDNTTLTYGNISLVFSNGNYSTYINGTRIVGPYNASSWFGNNIYLGTQIGGVTNVYWVCVGTYSSVANSGAYRSTNVRLGYESGTVKTDYGEDALDNVTIFFPQQSILTPESTVFDVGEVINELVVDGETDFSTEIDYSPAPPTPIPTTPLGEVPYDEWIDTFGQSVYSKLDEQTEAIDTYGQSAIEALEEATETIDTVGQDVVDAVESVDTNIQTGNGILSGIRSLVQSAVNSLASIAENVGELVQEIVLGTETLISGILNQIPSAFGVIFGPIKQASTIWHYVVEWIQSIGAPFQFIWSMASGTSYYVILPVYASLAAAVVLAFFKRFGR